MTVSEAESVPVVERVLAPVLDPVARLARLPAWFLAVLTGALATIPFLIHHDAEFKSDDFLLIARGVETGVLEGLVRNFTRPFCDTWTIEFYRPLFTWSFCVDGHLFGDDARGYFALNVAYHALAVATGFLVLRRLLGSGFALLAAVFFVANPWSANNVSWLVGRSAVVCSLLIWLGTLVYLRYVDRGRRKLPWAAFILGTAGIFYRETALYLPVLVFLIDLREGRRDARAFRDWCFLSLPFAVYMACKYLVLGTFIGGYARLFAMRGERFFPPTATEKLLTYLTAVGDLFVPGSGSGVYFDDSPLRLAALGVAAALLLLSFFGRAWKAPETWVFLTFVVLHAAPLLSVDQAVDGGTAQRWYTVMWAIAGFYASLARHARMPRVTVLVMLALGGFSVWRLHENLVDYDVSSRFSREVRRMIYEAPEDLVFVHNVVPYDQASAFYAVGLGQAALPPFGDGTKSVYPVFYTNRHGASAISQTPIASWLHSRGVGLTALWMDLPSRTVRHIPPARLDAAAALFAAMPRLTVVEPSAPVLRDVDQLTVKVRAGGIERIDLFLVCPLTELRFPRYRGLRYPTGGTGGFRRTEDGDLFVEDVTQMLESATLLDGPAKGRCWLWLVGYDTAEDGNEPVAVSDFFELHVTVPQAPPPR